MQYQPVVKAASGALQVTALVGAHTVILGFDLAGGLDQIADLLGFAVYRVDLRTGAEEWLKNPLKFKRTPHQGRFNIAGTPTNLAPIQQFHWADHRIENTPGAAYRYEIAAYYGDPRDPQPRDPPAVVEVIPAPDTAPGADPALSLFFNRGVVATPSYRQQFDNKRPGRNGAEDLDEARRYLSRGLWEALLSFIQQAERGDELCVAIYEFHHGSVVAALQDAIDRGVNVRLLYHARDGEEDERTVRENHAHAAQLRPAPDPGFPRPEVTPRRNVPRISHNKFILHKRAGKPYRIWTGSTNFTDAGFFLQTNAGMVIHEPELARAFDTYFELLYKDLEGAPLRRAIGEQNLRYTGHTVSQLFFAPVEGDRMLQTAAELIRNARDIVMISCPFGLEKDGAILQAIKALAPHVVVLGLLNTNQRGDLTIIDAGSHNTHEFAVPDWIKTLNGELYDASAGRGNQVHVKSLVVDPWGEHPGILIGSANFSDESVNDNDENALLIEGDRWAAAIVATEFLRAFEHYKFRNQIRLIAERVDTQGRLAERAAGGWASAVLSQPDEAPDEWFLDLDGLAAIDGLDGGAVLGMIEDADYWLTEDNSWAGDYFDLASPRYREREAFVG